MNEIEDGRERSLADEVKATKADLEKRIKAADWHYDYSDDSQVRQRGGKEVSQIYADMETLAAKDRKAAIEVWEANAPKDVNRPAGLDQRSSEAERTPGEPAAKPKTGPGSDRFANALDRAMAKAQLGERGWRDRSDIAKVMADLEALARTDAPKAIALWDKHRPGDPDKPLFIDNDDKPPVRQPEARRGTSPTPEAEKKPDDRPPPVEDPLLESLRRRYLVADDKYYKRDSVRTLAFEDHGRRLTTKHDDAEIAVSMVELAQIKGWETIKIKGSESFRREVWLQAQLQGLEVQGFKPQAVDLARLNERQADKDKPLIGSVNTIEKSERVQARHEPDLRGVRDEPNVRLTDSQVVALDALKAVMKDRGDGDKAIAMAEAVARERFQSSRVYVGKVVEQGSSPYGNDQKNEASPYLKLKTKLGEEVIWGADLPRALEEAKISVGDDITLTSPGKRAVTIKVKDWDEAGRVTGEREVVVNRNTWEARKLETLREEVKARVLQAAEAQVTPLRTFDAQAPRVQPRREISKPQVKINKDRSRG
ncbi:hypothetical protein ATDW_36470 (plasmid) [Asticcacaulis sp. DW145]|uniref:LPD7 domain-containing protein n=1 Tax=Asticcacaulis sp. DW145 TaxID=3095608 RepID=UPI00308FC57E|nr:hypothetical protein ATDW_36470 [Asticcacaulis sp. DW145]